MRETRLETFYLVWRVGGPNPTKKHDCANEARVEAGRLAALSPGIEFHVLKLYGTAFVEIPSVQYRTVD